MGLREESSKKSVDAKVYRLDSPDCRPAAPALTRFLVFPRLKVLRAPRSVNASAPTVQPKTMLLDLNDDGQAASLLPASWKPEMVNVGPLNARCSYLNL